VGWVSPTSSLQADFQLQTGVSRYVVLMAAATFTGTGRSPDKRHIGQTKKYILVFNLEINII